MMNGYNKLEALDFIVKRISEKDHKDIKRKLLRSAL